jgi:hypothetical protein
MGHGIDLISPGAGLVYQITLSYNWSSKSDLFHISEICGHRGRRVIKRLTQALNDLKGRGIEPNFEIVPGVDSWGWVDGGDRKIFHPENEDKDTGTNDKNLWRTFASVLDGFRDLAQTYPKAYWFSDCAEPRGPLDSINSISEQELDECFKYSKGVIDKINERILDLGLKIRKFKYLQRRHKIDVRPSIESLSKILIGDPSEKDSVKAHKLMRTIIDNWTPVPCLKSELIEMEWKLYQQNLLRLKNQRAREKMWKERDF